MDEIAPDSYAARFFDMVGCDPENRPAIDRARGNKPGAGTLAASSFLMRRRFSHGNNIKHASNLGVRLPKGVSRQWT